LTIDEKIVINCPLAVNVSFAGESMSPVRFSDDDQQTWLLQRTLHLSAHMLICRQRRLSWSVYL